MLTDLRYALRQWLKSPGFTLTALATIAICLGANLAIFGVINSVLLRPLPFPNADRLVPISYTFPTATGEHSGCALIDYFDTPRQMPALCAELLFMGGGE